MNSDTSKIAVEKTIAIENSVSQIMYNVNVAWPDVWPISPEDCMERAVNRILSGQTMGYRGDYQNWGCIRSSLDLHFEKNNICNEHRLSQETHMLETFVKDADPHLSPGARQHIDLSYLKWHSVRTTGTVYVGRHFGLPTRCIDWSSNPFVALFFACRRDFNEPGVVWWMNDGQFKDALAVQWPTFYEKTGFVEDDIEQDFIDGKETDVFVRLFYPPWMERPVKQKAWITMSGKYDVHHDEAIYRLGVRSCGRLIIHPYLKRHILAMLDRWCINGTTLGIGDSCVETIAADVARIKLKTTDNN